MAYEIGQDSVQRLLYMAGMRSKYKECKGLRQMYRVAEKLRKLDWVHNVKTSVYRKGRLGTGYVVYFKLES